MYQLLLGLAFIHHKRFLHRDIKPGNLLIDGARLKIADFGLARSISEPHRPYTPEVCTLVYRAPEVMLFKGKYTNELDIWSAGCVFFEMLTKTVLFRGDCQMDQLHHIFMLTSTPTLEEWPELAECDLKSGPMKQYPGIKIDDLYPELKEDPVAVDLMEVDRSDADDANIETCRPSFGQDCPGSPVLCRPYT